MASRSVKLSKSILDMKFMKRTKEKVQKEEEDEKARAMHSNEITEKMLRGDCPYIIEPSYVPCEDLDDGRYSFRGMNPDIERLAELELQAKQAKFEKNVRKDVTDEEMAEQYYSNVMKTIEKKYQSKNHRRKMTFPDPKFPAFKKPKIED